MDANRMAKIEELVEKVGGRYRLTVLIQKRLREISRKSPALVMDTSKNPLDIVLSEIDQEKISLVTEDEYRKYIRKQLGEEYEEEED